MHQCHHEKADVYRRTSQSRRKSLRTLWVLSQTGIQTPYRYSRQEQKLNFPCSVADAFVRTLLHVMFCSAHWRVCERLYAKFALNLMMMSDRPDCFICHGVQYCGSAPSRRSQGFSHTSAQQVTLLVKTASGSEICTRMR